MLYLRCQTQWRYAGDPPAHVGLDLTAVTAVMKAVGIKKRDRADTLARLQVIEHEAIKLFGRRRQSTSAPRGRR